MKTQIFRIVAGLAMAIAAFSAPQTASAAPLVQRTINVTYCWTLTTFGPTGCNANWPTEPLVFTGSGNQGPLYYGLGTTDAMTGTYKFTNNRNKLVLRFNAPEPGLVSVVYTGTRYAGGGPDCYRGPMLADRTTSPDLSGVWIGCIQP
jgi:hypothetical protein